MQNNLGAAWKSNSWQSAGSHPVLNCLFRRLRGFHPFQRIRVLMADLCAIASVMVSGWRFDAMDPKKAKGLSRRSQFLLWLLQHQPEIISVELEFEVSDDDDTELLDLSEDAELAEALLLTFLPLKTMPNSKQPRRTRSCVQQAASDHEANGESTDGD